ncbi:unnamed protein product [Fraxinus pennsylvanica]|uniref:Uncharacterized protein n=1 Tax=Fraxinus pennsylvanica TaxID=56036 RepID=A0AAD2E5G6_9LAMI|nr:unnamed protein product [Fraxinus pennsylvanica]
MSLKKLLPAKKVWKSFKNKLQSKLREINFSKSIKTTKKHCLEAWLCKFQTLTRRIARRRHHHYGFAKSSAIYVDALFPGQAKEMVGSSSGTFTAAKSENIKTLSEKKHVDEKISAGKGEPRNTNCADKWKIPLVPQFRGVDERAEEFIYKFREEMKLQREQSILEFEEMLARKHRDAASLKLHCTLRRNFALAGTSIDSSTASASVQRLQKVNLLTLVTVELLGAANCRVAQQLCSATATSMAGEKSRF